LATPFGVSRSSKELEELVLLNGLGISLVSVYFPLALLEREGEQFSLCIHQWGLVFLV
jgi:hypothetical protein